MQLVWVDLHGNIDGESCHWKDDIEQQSAVGLDVIILRLIIKAVKKA